MFLFVQTKKRSRQPDASEFAFLLSDWFPFGSATADKWAAWDINRCVYDNGSNNS